MYKMIEDGEEEEDAKERGISISFIHLHEWTGTKGIKYRTAKFGWTVVRWCVCNIRNEWCSLSLSHSVLFEMSHSFDLSLHLWCSICLHVFVLDIVFFDSMIWLYSRARARKYTHTSNGWSTQLRAYACMWTAIHRKWCDFIQLSFPTQRDVDAYENCNEGKIERQRDMMTERSCCNNFLVVGISNLTKAPQGFAMNATITEL